MIKQNDMDYEEEGFDIKQALYTIKRYKKSILAITILFMILSAVMAYYKPSLYFSTATLQAAPGAGNSGKGDPMLRALGYGGENQAINAEAVLSSKYLIEKMLESLEIGTRYFEDKNYRVKELYKKSPFVVSVTFMEYNLLGKKITIKPIDEDSFELIYNSDKGISFEKLMDTILFKKRRKINYEAIHKFGEEISTQFFRIKVTKISDLKQKNYYFSYIENKNMAYYVQKRLSTNPDAEYSMNLFVRFDDTVASRAKDILDALTSTFINDSIEQNKASTKMSLQFIDNQLSQINSTLNESEKVLQGFKQRNSLIDLKSKAANVAENVKKLEDELNTLTLEESVLENLKEYIEVNEDLTGLTVQPLEITATSLNELILKYQEATVQRRGMLVEVTEFHPEIIKLNEELYNLRKNIQVTTNLALENIRQRKTYLRDSLKKRKESLTQLPEQERRLGALTRNSSVNQNIHAFLLQKRVETAILHSSTLSTVRLMNEANLPISPYAPNKVRFLLMGTLLGLVFSIVLSFIRASRNNVVSDISELEKLTSLPLYGRIPYNRKNIDSMLQEEAYRTIRTNLEFIQVTTPSKTVMVGSSISGEGKSTTVKNLAKTLVKLNRKVIVLDFDLRRPSLHDFFDGINNNIGLSLLLSGQNSLQECIQKTTDGIDVISAGPTPPNPSELIMSEETEFLLSTLQKTYDYILIDTPPYSIVTDAIILMKKSDIVLFSVRNEYTNKESIKKINETVKRYELPATGIVYQGIKLEKKERVGYGYFDK